MSKGYENTYGWNRFKVTANTKSEARAKLKDAAKIPRSGRLPEGSLVVELKHGAERPVKPHREPGKRKRPVQLDRTFRLERRGSAHGWVPFDTPERWMGCIGAVNEARTKAGLPIL